MEQLYRKTIKRKYIPAQYIIVNYLWIEDMACRTKSNSISIAALRNKT